MRNLDFSDEGNSKLSDIRSKYNASKSKMNQKLKSLVNFLSVEEEVTGQDIQKSILDESKLHSEKLNFTLDDLKLGVFDNDSLFGEAAGEELARGAVNAAETAESPKELDLSNKTNEDLQLIIKRIKQEKNFSIEDLNKTKELEVQKTREMLQHKSKQQIEMIEKLLKEKKVLLQKYEEMTARLKDSDLRNKKNLVEAEERFNADMKKSREIWAEQEKEKREQFIAMKTKEIKEMTIKGLEPELQRMMKKSKEEVENKEKEFTEKLRKEKDSLMVNFEKQLNEQKHSLNGLRDNDLTRERESLSVKLKENWDLYQTQLKDTNEKWRNTFETEKERLDKLRQLDALKAEEKTSKLQEDISNLKIKNSEDIRNLRDEYEAKVKAQTAKIKEEMSLENDEW
eukprot:CAMPEP_0116896574 /NCGR_PEP_ID=MMETSP0467-20121206/5780_1 /TAXON_ID=283647 /ORGANISM="Mesodinium pulex, Strain SPMC105" /LENGTH=397 /DNA_ID=CAMNT_0004567805 /DNA_START=735 /DNA_END=1925 /DNA_ORIENTATION=-